MTDYRMTTAAVCHEDHEPCGSCLRCEVKIDDTLLAERAGFIARLAGIVGGCEAHGNECMPHIVTEVDGLRRDFGSLVAKLEGERHASALLIAALVTALGGEHTVTRADFEVTPSRRALVRDQKPDGSITLTVGPT